MQSEVRLMRSKKLKKVARLLSGPLVLALVVLIVAGQHGDRDGRGAQTGLNPA